MPEFRRILTALLAVFHLPTRKPPRAADGCTWSDTLEREINSDRAICRTLRI